MEETVYIWILWSIGSSRECKHKKGNTVEKVFESTKNRIQQDLLNYLSDQDDFHRRRYLTRSENPQDIIITCENTFNINMANKGN